MYSHCYSTNLQISFFTLCNWNSKLTEIIIPYSPLSSRPCLLPSCLASLKTPQKWNPTIFVVLWLADSLHTMSISFAHIIPQVRTSSLFILNNIHSMKRPQFICLPIDEHLSSFQLRAIFKNVAMITTVHMCLWGFSSFEFVFWSEIVGSYGNSIFNSLRGCYTVFP